MRPRRGSRASCCDGRRPAAVPALSLPRRKRASAQSRNPGLRQRLREVARLTEPQIAAATGHEVVRGVGFECWKWCSWAAEEYLDARALAQRHQLVVHVIGVRMFRSRAEW